MPALLRFLLSLLLLFLSPALLAIALLAFGIADLLFATFRPRQARRDVSPDTRAASIVIPTWNARDLLEKFLPSVVAAAIPGNEVIVVDNGSTDGTAEFVRQTFPQVRLLTLPRNLGFGGGSNAGIRAAANDIVVLLNNDKRVEPGFLSPLLAGFTDPRVFSVSCQIHFSDPSKRREETGLTEGTWQQGTLRVAHRVDPEVHDLFPCFYGGGGSCAYDRRKFLELGGFDPLLAPFYLEDTDLGYLAWKRGWKVLYQPNSVVYHEHRGTIGKRFSADDIQAILHKNFILFAWKNIHEWTRLLSSFFFTAASALVSLCFGASPQRSTFLAIGRAFLQLPGAIRSRWRARSLAEITDTEAFRRPLGAYFRDRFEPPPNPAEPLKVLFASPYPLCPPVHGGAVFMLQTCHQLLQLAELHLAVMIDDDHQAAHHATLASRCASAHFVPRDQNYPRLLGSTIPHAVREFSSGDFRWLIHRIVYQHRIDVLQLEYLAFAQYGGQFQRLACVLFEHDIYFQSIARRLKRPAGALTAARTACEYMRALRYELRVLPQFDRIHVCSQANADYLLRFLPQVASRLDAHSRAGLDLTRYPFRPGGREPNTLLFLGSFRHQPNVDALLWLLDRVLPLVLRERPRTRLVVVGSNPPEALALNRNNESIEFRGFVEDVREPLGRYAVFVCPILTGSGVRVKLLEAFASGIPAVSTRLGAEGLTDRDGEICCLAGSAEDFAARVLGLLQDTETAQAMARRAHEYLRHNRDIRMLTDRMVRDYREILARKRASG